VAILIHAFFMVSHFLFWVMFYREYASVREGMLKRACLLPVVGSFAVSCLYLKRLLFVFGIDGAIPTALMHPCVDALVPLVSSLLHLIFFVIFKRSMVPEEVRVLGRPVVSMMAGISLFLVLHVLVLANFIATDRFHWLEHMSRTAAVGTLPVIIAAVCLMLVFYCRFCRFLDVWYKRGIGGGGLQE